MTSFPKPNSKDKKIPHIDARSIEDISLDNKRLYDQIKYNTLCLNLKKKELHEHKIKENFMKIIKKSRKIFAFRLNMDIPIEIKTQQEIYKQLEEYIGKQNGKIKKIFMINNFIYLKTNINIQIAVENIDTNDGHVLEQINPKDILKIQ